MKINAYIKLAFLLLPLIIFMLILIIGLIGPLMIYPTSSSIKILPFTDVAEDGKTKITTFKEIKRELIFNYILNNAIKYPYAGIGFSSKKDQLFDISSFDSIAIKIYSSRAKIKIYLKLFSPEYTDPLKPESYIYLEKQFFVRHRISYYRLKLQDFSIPIWWYELNDIPLDTVISPDFSMLYRLEILNGDSFSIDEEESIKISHISLYKDQTPKFLYLGIGGTCYYIIILIAAYFKKK